MEIDYIFILDIIGVIAFAVSGVLTAVRKRMDPFGVFIVAFVTALGGGTLRDVLIEAPVIWMQNTLYIYVIIITVILAVLLRNKLVYISRPLIFFDTIGLSVFTLIVLEKALRAGFSPEICIATGTMTACFGGVIRDILANKIPIIFHKEIYATACILGGVVYFILHAFSTPNIITSIITFLTIFSLRSLAVYFDLKLLSFNFRK